MNVGTPGHIDHGTPQVADCCPDWKPGIAKIDNFIVMQSMRTGKDLYDGKSFNFCPWCGAKRSNRRG